MALDKNQLAQRIAKELQDGFYVNLGIGIPTLVANYIHEGMEVVLQSENGLLGMGPFPFEGEADADLINAGKQTITTVAGSAWATSRATPSGTKLRVGTPSSSALTTTRGRSAPPLRSRLKSTLLVQQYLSFRH